MIWIIVIGTVIFILGKFLFDTNQQANQVKKEGGMRVKYKILIDELLSGDPKTQVFKETSSSITFGLSNMGGTTLYILTQTYGKVTVQWKVNSPVFGKHSLEWDFSEYGDQHKMLERIINDIGKYQENVMTAQGFTDFMD